MDFENAKEELLSSLEPAEPAEKVTKRGSKDDLIEKIHKVCDENDIICEYSTTQLKRSTKKRLSEILAELIEKAMEKKIRDQIKLKSVEGATPEQNDRLVAIATLRLLHDSLARATEVGVERFTRYSIEGFSASMSNEQVSEQIDSCLGEIAAEYADVVQMISSPYTKLALIWTTSAAATCKRKPPILNKYGRRSRSMGPTSNAGEKTMDSGISGGAPSGKIRNADSPAKVV